MVVDREGVAKKDVKVGKDERGSEGVSKVSPLQPPGKFLSYNHHHNSISMQLPCNDWKLDHK